MSHYSGKCNRYALSNKFELIFVFLFFLNVRHLSVYFDLNKLLGTLSTQSKCVNGCPFSGKYVRVPLCNVC